GIWPPSNPTAVPPPERDFWPFWPFVDVLPWPEPMPRPTRLRRLTEPGAGRRSSSLTGHLHRVLHVVDHPANRRRVVVHGRLVDATEPERLHGRLLLGTHADDALRQRDLKLLACHSPPPRRPHPHGAAPRAHLEVA